VQIFIIYQYTVHKILNVDVNIHINNMILINVTAKHAHAKYFHPVGHVVAA